MITIRKSGERGYFDHGWLKTHHTFSFSDYFDPDHIQFRVLRVINEDYVDAGQGFATHSHKDMEIITYIVGGALQHKDSMGNTSIIRPGEVQRMSAGTGVTHSEFNPSSAEDVHLLQIWIVPAQKGLKPSYEQKTFDANGKKNRLRLAVSPKESPNVVTIHQDALVYDAFLEQEKSLTYEPKAGRGVWVQVITGELVMNGNQLKAGDGASAEKEKTLRFSANQAAEFLLFDLA